ncbi:hypothetical protein OC834_007285 [Tilletia horrida]|nr:hypothetical protein OC834_007285 [Tilletia horrida]
MKISAALLFVALIAVSQSGVSAERKTQSPKKPHSKPDPNAGTTQSDILIDAISTTYPPNNNGRKGHGRGKAGGGGHRARSVDELASAGNVLALRDLLDDSAISARSLPMAIILPSLQADGDGVFDPPGPRKRPQGSKGSQHKKHENNGGMNRIPAARDATAEALIQFTAIS